MDTVKDLVETVRTGNGRIMVLDHRIAVRNKPIGKLPVGIELEVTKARINLHIHSVMNGMKKAERKRYAAAFESRRRSQVSIRGRLSNGGKVTICFVDEKPQANEHFSKNDGEYVRETFHVSHLIIEGESATIAEHLTVSPGYAGGSEDAAEAYAIIPGAVFSGKNSSSNKRAEHPFHPSPSSSSSLVALTGETEGYKYCIETVNGDVVVSVKTDRASLVQDPDSAIEGVMAGAGFVNGFQPWPFYRVTKTRGKITKHILRTASNVQTTWHTPLRRGNPADWQHYSSMITAMAKLLGNGTLESKALNKLIWIAKQPCRNEVPMQVQLLTACAVLEGLRKPFDEEYKPGSKASARVKSKHKGKPDWDRLKFKAMFKRADISWQKIGHSIFQTWQKYRHPLAHGFLPRANQPSLEDYNDMYKSLVRVTYGIQLYLLRKAGYAGPVLITNNSGGLKHLILKQPKATELPDAIPPSPAGSP